MNKFLTNVAAAFVIGRERRREFRRSLQPPEPGDICGTGNVVIGKPESCSVRIWGNDNRVEFQKPCGSFNGTIFVGFHDCPVDNCTVVIGARTDAVGLTVWIMEDGSTLKIGSDCLISYEVFFWLSDTHALTDSDGRVLNASPHQIIIGNRCWIGFRAQLLKGVVLPLGSIVGLGAVVADRTFSCPNCAYAGNPARLVRENVFWDKRRPKGLLKKEDAVVRGETEDVPHI